MDNENKLILTQDDYQQLSALVMKSETEIAALLEEELSRATVVPADQLPKDVVKMNSRVKFVDLDSGRESEVTLVYPPYANMEENKVSVMAPVGAALIGLRVGQEIDWPLPTGKKRRIKVTSVAAAEVS